MTKQRENLRVFVYGSLMSKLESRHNPVAGKIGDYELSFILKGFSTWEPSFAAIIPAKGKSAWGVVASITEEEWLKITKHEISYNQTNLVATTSDNAKHHCLALVLKKGLDPQIKN